MVLTSLKRLALESSIQIKRWKILLSSGPSGIHRRQISKSLNEIRRWRILLSSRPSGIHRGGHGGGVLHVYSRPYLLLSIVTIQFELRALWTDLYPSKIRMKTPSELNSKGHQTKTKFKKITTNFRYLPYYMNH